MRVMLRLLSTLTLVFLLALTGMTIAARWIGGNTEPPILAHTDYRGIGLIDVERRLNTIFAIHRFLPIDQHIEWSPDGTQIVYSNTDLDAEINNGEIHVFDFNRMTIRRLTYTPANDRAPHWSPDGRLLVYTSENRVKQESGIFETTGIDISVVEASSGKPIDHLSRSGDFQIEPAWSPDGNKLAFWSSEIINQAYQDFHLHVMNVHDGSEITHVSPPGSRLIWSPDSERLVLMEPSEEGDGWILNTLDIQTGSFRQLARQVFGLPVISPDGQTIAFTTSESERLGVRTVLHLLDIESCESHILTDSGMSDSNPAWSPDGRWLAVKAIRGAVENLYVMDLETRLWSPLTSNHSLYIFIWSPDSRWIAFHRSTTGNGEIYAVRVPGGEAIRLTGDGTNYSPRWRP